MSDTATAKPKVTIEATIIRADGATEELGIICEMTPETEGEDNESFVQKLKKHYER